MFKCFAIHFTLHLLMIKTAELNGSRLILFISEIVCVHMHLLITSDRLCYGDDDNA